MRLPPFDYLAPESLALALAEKASLGAQGVWLAGGSDLLVRAKQRLIQPKTVISLKNLTPELSGIIARHGRIEIKSQTPLAQAAGHARLKQDHPGLCEALAAVGAPTLQQRVGTVGGNLCAQTRCIYYNQSPLFHSGLAPCFKLGGEICHPGGETADRCRSVCCSDGAIMLMALDAEVSLTSARGERVLPLSEFFTGKGEEPLALEPDELLTMVSLPSAGPKIGQAYEKLAWRSSLDFPLLSAGAWLRLEDGVIVEARLALGAVYAAPLLLKDAAQGLVGKKPEPEAISQAAKRAQSHAEPFILENLSAPAEWRRRMVAVVAGRALARAAARAKGGGHA